MSARSGQSEWNAVFSIYDLKSWSITNPFLNNWITRALKTNLEPMKKVTNMLRNHKALIMNWFKGKGLLSSGAVEGLNLKAKLTIRKAYDYKSPECLKIALYHTLGNLPEPKCLHRFS